MRTAIICGGKIENKFIKDYMAQISFDYIIAADRGMQFCYEECIVPDYILGDYDSISPEILEWYRRDAKVSMVTFPAEKDDTDAALAIEKALEAGSDEIYLFGALGGRMDHGLANIHMLKRIMDYGAEKDESQTSKDDNFLDEKEFQLKSRVNKKRKGYVIDSQNFMCLIEEECEIKKSEQFGKYISFLPFTDEVEGLTLEGFKYPLKDYHMKKGSSLGVSNEIQDEVCRVTLKSGILLMIQSKD